MKAWKKVVPAIAVLGLVLTACGQGNSEKSSTKSSSQETSSSVKSSNSSSSDASSSKSSSDENSSNSASSSHTDNKLGNEKLPRQNSAQAKISGDKANYNVRYSTDGATFNKKTYGNSSAASQQVDYQSSDSTNGLPSVDLGYNIKGHEDRGAGQAYVSTNFGNWSLVSHANIQNGDDTAVKNAKSAVKFIQNNSLPIPQSKGNIQIESDTESSVTWQEGNSVYKVKAPNATAALKMATSIK
ncbi:hypothetical protein [Apilactobacillus timberlakei]|uniref:Lipoprotein n=1 Tax=Apilactobacillus timberlakei TaxID=2008380 RepID=A0ABY2YY08_9LACO|nr:hypothetical protein [Apilactobacillus timberlakei]TPR14291.1 hypothetical protein DY048_04915 [Apilactobacillus timberlakei]TPR16544.1 hypothetical protein DY052_03005 [Apilactobacillus timberlakei]TPR19231.1 hypothetical protein DYZ95_01030 [Apilactobacillus timberlakei]